MAPADRRRVHELHLCPLRIVPCHLGCGITGLLAKDRDHHEKELCPERLVPCTYGCGLMVKAKALHFHLHGEDGDGGEHAACPRRPLRCLYNYVHKRLQIFGAEEVRAFVYCIVFASNFLVHTNAIYSVSSVSCRPWPRME